MERKDIHAIPATKSSGDSGDGGDKEPNWHGIAERLAEDFEAQEVALVMNERDRIRELLCSLKGRGAAHGEAVERLQDAYVSRLGYERASEIFKGLF